MPETWRLFIALELPEPVLSLLGAVQADLKRRVPARTVQWVNATGIHLTLKFLGEVPVEQRASIERALADAARGTRVFTLSTGTLGCFPNPRRPRVVWIGVERDVRALAALRDAVETFVAPLGYPTENRPFSPHLTLGRVRRDATPDAAAALGALVSAAPEPDRQAWAVDGISLMRSQLQAGGAVYTRLARVSLPRTVLPDE